MVITAQMYARRKQWLLESVRVVAQYARIKAEDCPDCKTAKGFLSEITLHMDLSGDLAVEQKERILEIAGRCPVKRALEGEIKFRAQLSREEDW
jgi:putative redox protein